MFQTADNFYRSTQAATDEVIASSTNPDWYYSNHRLARICNSPTEQVFLSIGFRQSQAHCNDYFAEEPSYVIFQIQYAVRDIRIPAINVTTEPRISFATGSTNLTQFDFPR